ncbi:hypothetical protein KSF78_0003903 [Schistosoma japonicum]|nr:hypothetical protein KSF78_0003903 [Schistosoma japonicum]
MESYIIQELRIERYKVVGPIPIDRDKNLPVAKTMRLMDNNSQKSTKRITKYMMKPELTTTLTLIRTSNKLSVRNFNIVKYAVTSGFVFGELPATEIHKIINTTFQSFFHDVKNQISKRDQRHKTKVKII